MGKSENYGYFENDCSLRPEKRQMQTHRSVQSTPPKNNQKLIDGSNRKTKQNKTNGVDVSMLLI